MKRNLFSLLLPAVLLLSPLSLPGCAGGAESGGLSVVCTTYPVYVFASAVAGGVRGVTVERLDTGSGSCLHDYTLSVNDMKKLERADLIAVNGAGLEDFLDDALKTSRARVADCSQGVELLEDPAGEEDPHYWMDLRNDKLMVNTLCAALTELDPGHGERYAFNAQEACTQLDWQIFSLPYALGLNALSPEAYPFAGLVTFHDGFQYFANALFLPLLASIEEEAGSEASAREIAEITQLVRENNLPVIFTEVNGSDATAQAIARETGCKVEQLSMLMDGPDSGDLLTAYLDGYVANLRAIRDGFAGEEAP